MAAKKVEVVTLKSELQKVISRGTGPSQVYGSELRKLRTKNDHLKATNALLSEEVQVLNKQLIKAHEDANE